MKYRKVLSGLLVAGMVFSNASVFATTEGIKPVESKINEATQIALEEGKTNLSQEEAEEILKKHIQDFYGSNLEEGKDGMQIYIEYREEPYMNRGVWQLNYSQQSGEEYISIHAMIDDETEELLSIRRYEGNHNEAGITKYTFDEAKDIAEKFLKEYNPKLLKELSAEPKQPSYYAQVGINGQGLHQREYYVFFERVNAGIPFMNDGVTIGVNSGTGEIASYQYQWSGEELPEKGDVITPEEAKKSFVESLDFKLQYVPVSKIGGYYGEPVKEVKLVYTPSFLEGHLVNAKDGKMINPHQQQAEEPKTIDVTEVEKKSFENLTSKNVVREKELSKEEAMSIAKETLSKFYEDFKIESINYHSNRGYDSQKIWQIQFKLGKDLYSHSGITINAMTGEVVRIDNNNWMRREMIMMGQEEFKSVLEWEDAYKQAMEAIKAMYPDKLKNVKTEQTYTEGHYYMNGIEMPNLEHNFNFNRVVNEIEFFHNNIRVSFDRITGQLQNLEYRWDDVEFPKPEGLIAKEKAVDTYMNQREMELAYTPISLSPMEKSSQEIMLVYRNTPKNEFIYHSIDAISGKFLDYRGQEIKEEKQKVESIKDLLKGHWAERELTIMYDNGILNLQDFNLKEEITKKEVIRMIVKSMGYYMDPRDTEMDLKFTDISEKDPYYEDIKSAVKLGVIENEAVAFNGENPVTREELAVMLVKMAKLEKLAKLQEIYTLPLGDVDNITPDYLGYTALAYGFEVIKGDGENYNPKKAMNLEEVAVAIYRSFNNLLYSIR